MNKKELATLLVIVLRISGHKMKERMKEIEKILFCHVYDHCKLKYVCLVIWGQNLLLN